MEKELKNIIKAYFNSMKIKFDHLMKYEKSLESNKLQNKNQNRVFIFDIAMVFRFLFGKLIKTNSLDEGMNISNTLFYTTEILNIIAHYKRFFNDKLNTKVVFYLIYSKPFDNKLEEVVFNNLLIISDHIKFINKTSLNSNDNIFKQLMFLKRQEKLRLDVIDLMNNTQINTILYSFCSNKIINSYLYEINGLDYSNPMSIIYYSHGEILLNTIENYFSQFSTVFENYKNIIKNKDIKFISNYPKPPLPILLIHPLYKRISKNKLKIFIDEYNNGIISKSSKLDKECINFYSKLEPLDIDINTIDVIQTNLNNKIFDKKIYDIQDFINNEIKINWILNK